MAILEPETLKDTLVLLMNSMAVFLEGNRETKALLDASVANQSDSDLRLALWREPCFIDFARSAEMNSRTLGSGSWTHSSRPPCCNRKRN
jgi:hypothetical protein